jgi:hypothetical protein
MIVSASVVYRTPWTGQRCAKTFAKGVARWYQLVPDFERLNSSTHQAEYIEPWPWVLVGSIPHSE